MCGRRIRLVGSSISRVPHLMLRLACVFLLCELHTLRGIRLGRVFTCFLAKYQKICTKTNSSRAVREVRQNLGSSTDDGSDDWHQSGLCIRYLHLAGCRLERRARAE
uniref:Putative secreted protein n=1 Tax=Anopheles marajoara TaxID=58244 RepID=A0A2M4C8F7_9DIPT